MSSNQNEVDQLFYITVLGRTLEHLGVQMYKRRDIAIAELVANSWDAGATRVDIAIPDENKYSSAHSEIVIVDNGSGMSVDQVQDEYLVVGRNRRALDIPNQSKRPIMGRKGIGKLAGFGVASEMLVLTWKDNLATTFKLDVNSLKRDAGISERVAIPGILSPTPSDTDSSSGTKIVLRSLKHTTPVGLDELREALSRRFSRRVRGEMSIYINTILIGEPNLNIEQRFPVEGYSEEILASGSQVRCFYGFTGSNIKSKELQGFTIYVRGKTAQAPPFFFHVEGTASGLHYTRYMTGEIEADFLDEGFDDESDLISTDRQEIDWADERSKELHTWGEELTRKALREWAEYRGHKMESFIMEDERLSRRINGMDKPLRAQVSRFLKQLGQAEPNPERAYILADALVRAYEYRHFHDVIDQIESVSADPAQLSLLLSHLSEWKVLESRAILEILKGRLEVIEKFHSMIVNNASETTSSKNLDNMHDLLAGYPWILNPEWQVLSEEKKISTQLRDWGIQEINDEDQRLRYDFLALSDEGRLVILEIKRAGHAVELEELQRLERYKDRLARASNKDLYMVMICAGALNISPTTQQVWEKRTDGEIRTWSDIYAKTHLYYEHYRAVLEGDIEHTDFSRKELEIAQTRNILQYGAVHRNSNVRRLGLGPQDRHDPVDI